MEKWLADNRRLLLCTSVLLLSILVSWILYGFFGFRLIEAMYNTRSNTIVDYLMPGRPATPLEHYYEEADKMIWASTFWVVILFGIVTLLVKTRLLGKVVLVFSSFIIFELLVFSFFELFPPLIEPLHLDEIWYYDYKAHYLPDEKLAYKYKPLISKKGDKFRGGQYSPIFRAQVAPLKFEWMIDKEGFRNSRVKALSDIVVIGDSYIDSGENEADTFGKRLEKLLGLSVTNLGVAGYGPFQYLEVLRRYGIKKKPKFAFFCFYEGNDLGDISKYLDWKRGGDYLGSGSLSYGFVRRNISAVTATTDYITGTMRTRAQLIFNKLRQNEDIHPDIVVLNLGKGGYHRVLLSRHTPRSTDEILGSVEGKELRKILKEFEDVSGANNILPIILYIPVATHIYAEYSTEESGKNWLKIRRYAINAKANTENAVVHLARELDIELISLTPAFESAAKEGRLLYYPLDTHWNSEGRAIAAAFVAQRLRNKLTSSY